MSPLVGYLLLFLLVGFGFIFIHLVVGKLVRPAKPQAEKLTIYECGEPTIGSAWVQFDLRYYVVALLFVIFDVEVAFFFPWAVVFGQANALARLEEPADPQQVLAKRQLLDMQDPERALSDQEKDQVNAVGRQLGWLALGDILVFFGVLLVGFAYLWKRGDLAWVKTTTTEAGPAPPVAPTADGARPELIAAGR